MLRAARERRGLSLNQVAATTKISLAILEALEKNDVAKLPGGLFSRAFVRSFAEEVGLDPDQAVEAFAARATSRPMIGARSPAERVDDNEAFESNRQIAAAFVRLGAVSAVLVALIVYVGSVGRRPQPGGSSTPGGAAARGMQASAGNAGNAATSRETGSNAADGAATVSAAEETVIVALAATRNCDVSVSVDGGPVVDRHLEPGDRYVVKMRREATLSLADASAVAVTFDGAEARPLGGPGESVTIHLNPANIKDYLLIR
jgi:cytoskeleton protein RodZ